MGKVKELLFNLKSDIKRYSYGSESKYYLILKSLTKIGFWAVFNYRLGVFLRDTTKHIVLLNYLVLVFTLLSRTFIEILTGISISYHSKIGPGLLIAHFSNVMVGDGVIIGKNMTLHQGVTLGVSGNKDNRGVPIIGDNVFIGANAVIAGKVFIGNNVSVSANSFVSKSIDPNSVVINNNFHVIERGKNV